ncbi:MAG: glycosyl transferase, partial [Bacillota bacterium]
NLSVECVPVGYRDRPEDSPSKLNTVSDGFKVLKTITRLFKEYRPMPFFGLLALILVLAATGLFIPILIEFVQTGLVPRFPTLIIAGVMATLAILLLTCGVILDTVAKKHRQLFEVNLNILRALKPEEMK